MYYMIVCYVLYDFMSVGFWKSTTIGREICLWLPGYRSGGRSLKGNSPREHFQTNGTFHTFLLCWHLHNGMTSLAAQTVKRLSTMRETRVRSLGREVPWRRKWQSTPVLLPGKSHGQRSLVSYSPWRCKESDTTERSLP